jgi:hypothetical protein
MENHGFQSFFCPQCGAPLEPGAGFCGNCGTRAMNKAKTVPLSRAAVLKVLIPSILIPVAAALAVVIVVMIAVRPEPSPMDPIMKFEKAYNELDYVKMIECVDPRATDVMLNLSGAVGSLLGIDVNTNLIKSIMPLAGDYLSGYAKDYWEERGISMSMRVTEISTEMIRDDKAAVTCQIEFESSDGSYEVVEETIKTVEIDGKWYIALF